MLFTDISDFQTAVGGAVNHSFSLDSLDPFFRIAHERHIEDWLGSDLLDDLALAVESNDLSPAQLELLPRYQRALAWLALYEYHPHAAVQFSEAGLMRVETDSHKTAYKYQEAAKLQSTLVNGYEALEKLIIFLDNNRNSYPEWENAPGFDRHHAVLLHTAALFRIAQNKKITRQVFDQVRPVIEDVEQFAIVPLIGQAQYDALLESRRSGFYASIEKEQKIIYILQRAIAHFTLENAIRQNLVQFTGDAVVQKELPDALPATRTASDAAVSLRLLFHDDTGNRFLKQAKAYLDARLDDPAFSPYAQHLEDLAAQEQAYQDSRPQEIPLQFADTSPRHDWGNAFGFETEFPQKRKGVSRL